MAIGIFDSGVGGLTVAQAIRRRLPAEALYYLGDTARVPYGNKSRETVIRYALESAHFLHRRGVKALVIACNTSTAYALAAVRAAVDIPVIGVIEPGVRAAVAASRCGRIGVIATASTVASNAYVDTLTAAQPTATIISRACPLFVPLVEEGWLDGPATEYIIDQYLSPFRTEQIDTLILGCTHYPLLAAGIQRAVGPEVTLVDSGMAVAEDTARLLAEQDALATRHGQGELQLFITDASPQFVHFAERLLGAPHIAPTVVEIEV